MDWLYFPFHGGWSLKVLINEQCREASGAAAYPVPGLESGVIKLASLANSKFTNNF